MSYNSAQFWDNARKIRQNLAALTAKISNDLKLSSSSSSSGGVSLISYGTLSGGGKRISNSYFAKKYITGTDYADEIFCGNGTYAGIYDGRDCTILTGAGNDVIEGLANGLYIYAGTGNDTIKLGSVSEGNVILYHNGDGNDRIEHFVNEYVSGANKLQIASGKYYTQNHGEDVLVHVGNGTITLVGARGNYLNIEGTYDTSVKVQTGKTIENTEPLTVVTGSAYDDLIISNAKAEPSTMRGIYGNIQTLSPGGPVTINAGAGDDYVKTYPGSATTINAGKGDDTIYALGKEICIVYANGDGNDSINSYYPNTTLSIMGGSYSTQTSGNNVIVTVGQGKITLVGAKGQKLNIKGTKASTSSSTGKNISNSTSNKAVNGTSYADKISNGYSGHHVTIAAGAGNDTVSNLGDTVKIDGGAGNDSIYSYSYYGTINGGKDNDIITLNSSGHHNVIEYASGDGNDKIYNLGATDTLSITGGTYSSQTSGSDVILTVGSGKITLVGGKGKTLNIKGTKASTSTTTSTSTGKNISNSSSNKKISGTSGADTLYNYGGNVSMNGAAGNDKIVSFSNGSKVTLVGGAGNDTLQSWSARSKLDGGDGADSLYAGANYSTVLGGAGNDSFINYGSYNSILGGAGNDTIENTNLGKYSTLNGGAGNDVLKAGGASYDTLIGGKGNDTLWGGNGVDTFIYGSGDGSDTIYSFGSNDLLQITGTFSASYNKTSGDVFFKVGSDKITLKNSTTTTFHVNNKTYRIK